MNQPQMYESASISGFFLFFFNLAAIKVVLRMKMIKILVYRVWTRRNIAALAVNFHCATNAHFQKKTTKFQVGKSKSLRIVRLDSKEAFEQGTQYSTHFVRGADAFAVSGLKAPFSLFRSRKNVLHFEPARAYYIRMNHRC